MATAIAAEEAAKNEIVFKLAKNGSPKAVISPPNVVPRHLKSRRPNVIASAAKVQR